jgi:hypothetical protein
MFAMFPTKHRLFAADQRINATLALNDHDNASLAPLSKTCACANMKLEVRLRRSTSIFWVTSTFLCICIGVHPSTLMWGTPSGVVQPKHTR